MGDDMRCPRCGMDLNAGEEICPNCNTPITSTNLNNNEVVEAGIVQTQSNELIEQRAPIEQNVITNQQVINETPVVDTTFNQQDTNSNATVVNESAIGQSNEVNNASLLMDTQNKLVSNEVGSVSQKKDFSKIYYIILAVAVIIFLVLMGFIISTNLKKEQTIEPTPQQKTTESTVETILTKNKGVYTNIISPTNIGNITYGGLRDTINDKVVDADVEIIRHLSADEIDVFLAAYDYILIPGFKLDGVEYRVTLNDFDYLNGASISPVMKTYLFDTYYKNNFFLVNENYYTITPISGNGPEIKNGESAVLRVVYQVPIDQNYYICFGENFSSLGCFINS